MVLPELPEVETIRRVLEPQLKGRRITEVVITNPQVIERPSAEEFCAALRGQHIIGMARRGKFLSILLQSGDRITLHLRMTGCLLLVPRGDQAEKHTHVVFCLDNGTELRFVDARRFGRFWLIAKGEEDLYSGLQKLGLEPFDSALSAEYLIGSLGKRRKTIKECLLDQDVIAGIGNIYADEILFTAKLCPCRPACSLSDAEWQRLAKIIPERLAYFTEKNIPSPQEYLAGKGQDYRNTPFLQVYGHGGEPCPVCGGPLQRVVIGGRSSVYCPDCQEEKPC